MRLPKEDIEGLQERRRVKQWTDIHARIQSPLSATERLQAAVLAELEIDSLADLPPNEAAFVVRALLNLEDTDSEHLLNTLRRAKATAVRKQAR